MQDLVKNNDQKFNFQINSLKDAMDYAKLISDSDLAPKDYKGKPGNVLIAMQYGSEIGLLPMQAIQNIAVINGRPSIWGDALIALVQNHPLCEYIKEPEVENNVAYCHVKRRGEELHTAKFSVEDAKKAGLWGKQGPWSNYPNRMLQMRARAFALRDKFSDVLKGLAMREEVEDYQVIPLSDTKKHSAEVKVKELLEQKSNPLPNLLSENVVRGLIERFAKIGITANELEIKLGHPINETTNQEVSDLKQFYKEMKGGVEDDKKQVQLPD